MEDAAPEKSGIPLPQSGSADQTAAQADPADETTAEEVDVWYGAYSGRAMIPRLLQLTLLTILITVVAWYFGAWRGSGLVRVAALATICLLWVVQAVSWLRRAIGCNYRLTTRRLYYQHGFGHPGKPGIELRDITQVLVEASRVERWLDVGRVRVYSHETSTPVLLDGVLHPFHVAKQIQRRMRRI
jgi:membrane protein YdbS with pleckstrin-like domain